MISRTFEARHCIWFVSTFVLSGSGLTSSFQVYRTPNISYLFRLFSGGYFRGIVFQMSYNPKPFFWASKNPREVFKTEGCKHEVRTRLMFLLIIRRENFAKKLTVSDSRRSGIAVLRRYMMAPNTPGCDSNASFPLPLAWDVISNGHCNHTTQKHDWDVPWCGACREWEIIDVRLKNLQLVHHWRVFLPCCVLLFCHGQNSIIDWGILTAVATKRTKTIMKRLLRSNSPILTKARS